MEDRRTSHGEKSGLSLEVRLVCLAFLMWFAARAILLHTGAFSDFTAWLLFAQDQWLLFAAPFILLAASIKLRPGKVRFHISTRDMIVLSLAVIPLCYLGYFWALSGFDVSRDEQLAVFDARIFSHGLLAQPLPLMWQKHTAALNGLYLLPAVRPVAWVSSYLPINAALRSLVGLILDPALTGPILTAVGAVALWKCARRLWPEEREAAPLALFLYLASGQVLITGMSAYAMPAHLTFNLLWLWLFLIDRRRWDVAALAIGALAVGIHEPLFHPMFVAPFVLLLLWRRAWARAALFIVGYALIGAFWFAWPHWMHAIIEGGGAVTSPGGDFLDRLRAVLAGHSGSRWISMASNLLRFAAWQPILLLPLFVAGFATARRNGMMVALIAASLLPGIVMGILIPDQGQGIGYRYLHGVIGTIILIAVGGWLRMVAIDARWRPLLSRTLVLGMIIILPMQLHMTRHYQESFARIDRDIQSTGTDYFIIGNDDAPIANSLVINRPDLTNRPLRLFPDRLDSGLIEAMCAHHQSVGMPATSLYAPINDYFSGASISHSADRRIRKLGVQLHKAGCRVIVVGRT